MPTEIKQEKRPFEKNLYCIRMDFSELVEVLDTINIDEDSLQATSNNAKFVGLNDVKSAPNRFAGEPKIRITKLFDKESAASANVDFGRQKTVISAAHSTQHVLIQHNEELAKHLYEELGSVSV